MKKVTLGGERLGNGKKIKVDLHGWGRSTFDQSRIWRSTTGVGMLTPCFKEIGLPGTTFDIDINMLGHTIPTISPLFGSFKLQIDMFACPIRLYQGILHNNAVNIGLDMSEVLLPQIKIGKGASNTEFNKMCTTSLNNYLGIKGRTEEMNTFSGLRHLAYYDIFKNYYSNKQEEKAKVIGNQRTIRIVPTIKFYWEEGAKADPIFMVDESYKNTENYRRLINGQNGNGARKQVIKNAEQINEREWEYFDNTIQINGTIPTKTSEEKVNVFYIQGDFDKINYFEVETNIGTFKTDQETLIKGIENKVGLYNNNNRIFGSVTKIDDNNYKFAFDIAGIGNVGNISLISWNNYKEEYAIYDFDLTNIDDARRTILAKTQLGRRIVLNEDLNILPYKLNFEDTSDNPSEFNEFQGLCLKTYQNDIFNCWLSTEFVEKINDLTSITTNENGEFSMDALILAKKVYNILNRIAINGGTYEDWQESVYGENPIERNESPIYIGGASAEITFEEVVATTSAENQALGTLGGKGIMTNKKGGNIIYKCNEPCIIMGICSITPRVDYYQGNDWFMTNIDNMDNFHKPGLDGIGFEDLIENNIVWTGSPNVSMAKTTAWINYQTAVNEVFGQFALGDEDTNTLHHMVLRRNYETNSQGELTDFTSYIDPSKYNYAFVDNTLKAQNFWLQIGFNVKSRRKMAASEIPNL